MNKKRKPLISALLGAGIFCAALAAQSLLSRAAALPPSPGCGMGATAGVLCQVNSDGCELLQGISGLNSCNTGTGSTHMYVAHDILSISTGQFCGAGSSGNSAYASLFCSDGTKIVLSGGAIHPNETFSCPNFPLLSVCGNAIACASYTP